MSAETIARALGGQRLGSTWMAPCPSHEDRRPSLSICEAENGKVLIHCHAGCSQRDVIAELRLRGIWQPDACGAIRYFKKVHDERGTQPNVRSEAQNPDGIPDLAGFAACR